MTRFCAAQQQAFEANRAIVDAGLVILSFGNASAVDRDQGVIAIKPSGVPYPELRPDSMVVVDLDSGRILAGADRPSSDTPTHLVLYRQFEHVGAVIHTHSAFATAWAQSRLPLPCFGTTHADHFHGPVPVTRDLAPDEIRGSYETETGSVVCETFEQQRIDPRAVPAILVASHGPFVWGADATEAVENAIALEAVAAMAYRTIVLRAGSEVAEIGDELLERHFRRKHGPNAYYGQGR